MIESIQLPVGFCTAGAGPVPQNWGITGTWSAACTPVTAAGGVNLFHLDSNAAADVIMAMYVVPPTLTAVSVHINGFPVATGALALSWSATTGCVAASGAAFNAGTQNAATTATVAATVSGITTPFDMVGLDLGTCAAGDTLYLALLRGGPYVGNYDFQSIVIQNTRTLP